jgi:cobalt/nickel transport system permease protein
MLAVAFVAAWVSVMVAALATTLQLATSGTSPLDVALPAMMSVHALIGIGEGLVTAAALGFVVATRPDLVNIRTPLAAEG